MDIFPIILVIHLLLALGLVGVVLLQRSEGGALGIGGSSGNVMSGRAAGNLLTRATAILGGAFFVTSLVLATIANTRAGGASPFDQIPDAPVAAPAAPTGPSAPLAK
jgi:preprotein translocase subunit SecG